MEVLYGKLVRKRIEKRKLPQEVWANFRDAFTSLAVTMNFRLFDVKKLVAKGALKYYRLRIGKYRALFHFDDSCIYVEDIAPRSEVYRTWQ